MWDLIVPEKVKQRYRAEGKVVVELELVVKENALRAVKSDLVAAQARLRQYRTHEFIDVFVGDPTPEDSEKRKVFVGAVAGLFNDYLRPKFLQMIATTRAILEDVENTPKQDDQIKGSLFALWEIIRWGDIMVSEYKATIAGENPSSSIDKK